MKEKLQGVVAGIFISILCFTGVAYAKTTTKSIEVYYDNIKVYKDNVLCELKDANGTVLEPFIYEGTTYMPVRGTANLAGMEVTWDGPSKSVYLWDEQVPDGTYLMETCPPYETQRYYDFLQQQGRSFQMAGRKYSNGFTLGGDSGYAMINLDSKYSAVDFTVGHVDDSSMGDVTVSFFVDGRLIKEITVGSSDMPKTISLPVKYGLQLKIVTSDYYYARVGFGNITLQS